MTPDRTFWRGRRVLVTGHTGFKGGWLAIWLKRLGANVAGIALAPETTPNLFTLADIAGLSDSHFCDIRDFGALQPLVAKAQPEIVFHLAAQPLVRASYRDPLATYATNVMGTAHVLESLRDVASLRAAVMVTTDKVYRNLEQPFPYREKDALGGHDPYAASKAASEIIISSYRDAFLAERGAAIASARAGNVIGGGDWSEDRLLPDAVRAWGKGEALHVRRPSATRPWQHVLEPLCGYLALAQAVSEGRAPAEAYNFGPPTQEAACVRDVVALAQDAYGGGEVIFATEETGPHEAGWLALEIAKARALLAVMPRWSLNEAVGRTMAWYRAQAAGASARALCDADIDAFESAA